MRVTEFFYYQFNTMYNYEYEQRIYIEAVEDILFEELYNEFIRQCTVIKKFEQKQNSMIKMFKMASFENFIQKPRSNNDFKVWKFDKFIPFNKITQTKYKIWIQRQLKDLVCFELQTRDYIYNTEITDFNEIQNTSRDSLEQVYKNIAYVNWYIYMEAQQIAYQSQLNINQLGLQKYYIKLEEIKDEEELLNNEYNLTIDINRELALYEEQLEYYDE